MSYLKELPDDGLLPCVIMLDMNMPKINGKDTLLRIRQLSRFSGVPIIFFTTSSYKEDLIFARQHGAGFISKPIDQLQMRKLTREILAHCTDEVRNLAP